jgi:prevent-host-death family protein
MEISVREARSRLSELLDRVQGGEEVIILRRGREAGRLVPPRGDKRVLPKMKDFRATLRVTGRPVSTAVINGRKEERF